MNTAAQILQEMREMRAVMRLSSGTALMTVADIAAYLGVADSTVRQKTLTRADCPRPVRITDDAKGLRWKPIEVQQWAESKREALPKGQGRV